jgi:Cu/Ag efflux protein CusF
VTPPNAKKEKQMQKIKTLISITAAVLLAAGTPVVAHEDGSMTPGQVMKIDESAGKMTIKHEPIKHLDMGEMTMVFKASDPAMLKTVRPGDKIKFHADKVNGQITVMKLQKTK